MVMMLMSDMFQVVLAVLGHIWLHLHCAFLWPDAPDAPGAHAMNYPAGEPFAALRDCQKSSRFSDASRT